jgi:hypothetical protein
VKFFKIKKMFLIKIFSDLKIKNLKKSTLSFVKSISQPNFPCSKKVDKIKPR